MMSMGLTSQSQRGAGGGAPLAVKNLFLQYYTHYVTRFALFLKPTPRQDTMTVPCPLLPLPPAPASPPSCSSSLARFFLLPALLPALALALALALAPPLPASPPTAACGASLKVHPKKSRSSLSVAMAAGESLPMRSRDTF